ncbi:MAG: hypothetical protein WBM02_00260 [bacterium]
MNLPDWSSGAMQLPFHAPFSANVLKLTHLFPSAKSFKVDAA